MLSERWDSLLDDSRIGDPRVGVDIMERHEGVLMDVLTYLGFQISKHDSADGWVQAVRRDKDSLNKPYWIPVCASELPDPPIRGPFLGTFGEREAFDAGGNATLVEYRKTK